MPAKQPRSYQLSSALVASSVGAGVVCLAPAGMGRTYRLHASRPGPERNRPLMRADIGADLPSGAAHVIAPVAPLLTRVDISGPLEQRAGYHDPCSGWTDGHDAIAERLCAAFASGDVLLVVDSPGGAAAGLQQAAARALKAKLHHGRRVTVYADEMIGSAAGRRGIRSLRQRLQLLRRDPWVVLGFGVPTFLLLSVPVLALVIFPIATAGGTLLTRRLVARAPVAA